MASSVWLVPVGVGASVVGGILLAFGLRGLRCR